LIEIDVQMSGDCVPFLRHNYQLPDGRWCGQLPWSELKNFKTHGESLPLLEDVLIWARDTGAMLSLDVKTFFSTEGSLTTEVVRLLERTNMKDKALLLFFDHQELLHTKLAYPELTVRALVIGRLADYPEYIQKIQADCVSISFGAFHPVDIEQIHSIGVSVSLNGLWNLNSDLFQTLDIDIFSYGNPVEARKILGRQ